MTRSISRAAAGSLALGLGVLALASCSADTTDFKEQGEKFLEGDEVRERFGMVRMSEAECQEPANTDEDTIYTCTATGSDGNTWSFTIEITGSDSLQVTSGEVVTQGSVPADTTGSSPTAVPTTLVPATTTPSTPAGPSTAAAPTTAAG